MFHLPGEGPVPDGLIEKEPSDKASGAVRLTITERQEQHHDKRNPFRSLF
jgi:hypothetical protein